MIKKFLILATVASSLIIGGCQELPPTPNNENPPLQNDKPVTENPKVEKNLPAPENKNPEPPKVVKPATQNTSQKINIKVYFPDDAGINLVAVDRTVEIKNDAEKYFAAVNSLINYPGEKDLTVIFPKNAKINSVTFKNGTAFVDFDKNIKKSFAGGSTGEELLVNSVVKTLTEFPEVKQVRFLIDGKEIETLSGHMDLSEPIKKSDL